MQRLPDWDVRLVDWAATRLGAPFEFGVTNCVQLALEAFDAMTGAEVAAKYRGRYKSEREGRRLMLRERVDPLTGLLNLGCVPVPRGFAQRGDIVCMVVGYQHYQHVVFGGETLASRPDTGVAWFELAAVLAAPAAASAVILRVP